MMRRALTCIICPNGCYVEAEVQDRGGQLKVLEVTGALCKKGEKWVRQELVQPLRTISSSVVVEGGEFPLVSVRTDSPIPLESVFRVMEEIKKTRVHAPVEIGQVILPNPAGTSCNIIATRMVPPNSHRA